MMDKISGTSPHQFVGYWGYGYQEKLEDLLSKVVNRYQCTTSEYSHKNIENNIANPTWNVVDIYDSYSQSSRKDFDYQPENLFSSRPIARISAEGILKSRDVWVNIHK